MKQLSRKLSPAAAGEKILTVPEEVKDYLPYHLTGNEYVSLPLINPVTGGLERVSVLHMGTRGLLEFCGSAGRPLLEPYVEVENIEGTCRYPEKEATVKYPEKNDTAKHPEKTPVWEYEGEWLPRSTYFLGDLEVRYQIVTPPETKGFVYIIGLLNRSDSPVKTRSGFKGHWQETLSTIYTSQHPWGQNHLYHNTWTDALILEFKAPTGLAALALGLDTATGREKEPLTANPVIEQNPALKAIEFDLSRSGIIPPREGMVVALYGGINQEGDGAGATLVDLRRRGWDNLRQECVRWLRRHHLECKNTRLGEVLNRNLFFNYYYSQGKTIDTEELVLVTSRSPRYYVSAAYWPRDTFLWSFPAILLVNPGRAREMLLTGFRRHLANAAIHSHYINGVVLYPGFELDQLCAYTVALESYLDLTGDSSILELPEICSGLVGLLDELGKHQGEGVHLCSTFLDPSDDPVTYPYLTYANVLVWKMLNFLSGVFRKPLLCRQAPGVKPVDGEMLAEVARHFREDIYKYCVAEGPFGPMFVWSTDAQGNYELYDNPPGSLQLLAHYGFCPYRDKVYLNTLRWAHSEYNPFYKAGGRYNELGSVHARNPWVLAACNTLLATRFPEGFPGEQEAGIVKDFEPELTRIRRNAWELLLQAPMDNGLACETVDPASGIVRTGLAFATCAGFLAYTLAGEVGNNG